MTDQERTAWYGLFMGILTDKTPKKKREIWGSHFKKLIELGIIKNPTFDWTETQTNQK